MEIYLPIAAVSQDVVVLLLLGAAVGILTGMFGVGGGFLLTPLLIFLGVPQAVAVGSAANQLAGASIAGVIPHWRRGSLDPLMAGVLIAGGVCGSLAGVQLFGLLRRIGQIELVISLGYVLLLGSLGSLMLVESVGVVLRMRLADARNRRAHEHSWLHRLPLKVRFRRSRLYISALLPLTLGFVAGLLSAILGIGGGFIVVPAMIYILGMPASLVPGTSLLQTAVIAVCTTILQAVTNHTVDAMLALTLLCGAVFGVRYGTWLGARVEGDYLRILLSALILAVGAKLLYDITVEPAGLFSVTLRR